MKSVSQAIFLMLISVITAPTVSWAKGFAISSYSIQKAASDVTASMKVKVWPATDGRINVCNFYDFQVTPNSIDGTSHGVTTKISSLGTKFIIQNTSAEDILINSRIGVGDPFVDGSNWRILLPKISSETKFSAQSHGYDHDVAIIHKGEAIEVDIGQSSVDSIGVALVFECHSLRDFLLTMSKKQTPFKYNSRVIYDF